MRLVPQRAAVLGATTSTSTSMSRVRSSVAGDPLREAIRRLRIITLAFAVGPAVFAGLVIALAPPGSPQHEARLQTIALISMVALTAAVLRRVLGDERIKPQTRVSIGFSFEVLVALMMAVERHLLPWPAGAGFRDVSPLVVVILVFAALVPNPPRRTLFISLAAAAMDPVGLGLSIARGTPAPPLVQMIALCAGPFVAAVLATLVSRVVHGLARSADEARRLGSYQLVERLGAGGMGEVWRAHHELLARPAAVKLIRPETLGDVGALRRFEREAQATAALQSPHTVQLFDFGVAEDGTFYYVMELLDGLDLENLVRKHGAVSPSRAVHVLRQVCASLAEAHATGLVHRDIKPANIYLCRYGLALDFAKVLDFGLVKRTEREEEGDDRALAATQSILGTIAGTPAFLAPEMALGDQEIDARADVYALGCVAYWLLTGALVFDADSPLKMIVEHARGTPIAPSVRANKELPQDLERVILDCLEKDRAKRPATAEELDRRLAAVDVPPWTRDDAAAWWSDHASTGPASLALHPTELAPTELGSTPTVDPAPARAEA